METRVRYTMDVLVSYLALSGKLIDGPNDWPADAEPQDASRFDLSYDSYHT